MEKFLKRKLLAFAVAAIIVLLSISVLLTGCGGPAEDNVTTLETFAKLDDSGLYYLEYKENYKFDEFLQIGAEGDENEKSDVKFANYINKELGTDIDIELVGGCTTFSGKIESGDRIFARNFDYNSAIPLIVKTNPTNGYKSISTVNLEHIGYSDDNLPSADDEDSLKNLLAVPYIPLDGVNEKGLAIGVLQINWLPALQTAENKITLPTTAMIRMVLDKAATVDEAISLMRKYNISDSLGSNFHYQIADRTGRSVVVEYVNNNVLKYTNMIVIEQGTGDDYHCAENFLLSDIGALIQSTSYKGGIGSKARYGVLKTALTENNGAFADMNEALELLEAANQDNAGSSSSWTYWSVVYNLSNSTSLFVPNSLYSNTYTFAV